MAGLIHFYHLWLGGAWREIAAEHFRALSAAQFPGPVHVGLVGTEENRCAARELLAEWQPQVAAEADAGYEEVTLRELHRAAAHLPGDTAVLYMHSKGTFNLTHTNLLWSKSMTEYLVGSWHERVAELADHDLAAQTWLSPDTRAPDGRRLGAFIAAGNFWWARADYVVSLPPLPALLDDRYEAEGWVGQDGPYVCFESNAWPTVPQVWQQVMCTDGGIAQVKWVPVY